MRYDAYRAQTARAAAALAQIVPAAHQTSLAGGYYGVTWKTSDGRSVVVALDLDGAQPTWLTWTEDSDGERCCDDNATDLGIIRPADYGTTLLGRAFRAWLEHQH